MHDGQTGLIASTSHTTEWIVARRLAACVVGACLSTSSVHGQGQRAADTVAQAKSVNCVFTAMASGAWDDSGAHAATKPTTVKIGFDKIDPDEGTARVIGQYGRSDIVVKLSAGTLHFMQVFREGGSLYITTVFPQESHDGKLKATHSRHEYTAVSLPGFTSRPEQYYGECDVVD